MPAGSRPHQRSAGPRYSTSRCGPWAVASAISSVKRTWLGLGLGLEG